MCTFFFVYVVYRILDILFIKSVYLIPGVPCNWCTFIWCTLYLVYLYLMYLVPGVLCTWYTLYLVYLVPVVRVVPCTWCTFTWCTLYQVYFVTKVYFVPGVPYPGVPCTWCTCSIWWLGSSARKVLKGWVMCAMILFSILQMLFSAFVRFWTGTCISCTRPCRGGCTEGRGLRWRGLQPKSPPSGLGPSKN